MLAQSARAHQAALALAPLRPDLAALSSGRWSVGRTGGELYQDSRQGVYVLPVQARLFALQLLCNSRLEAGAFDCRVHVFEHRVSRGA